MHATRRTSSGIHDDIASLTVRRGFRRWPWPQPWLPFRDDEPVIAELITGNAVGDQSGQLVTTLEKAGTQVSAVVRISDFPVGEPDTGIAPLVRMIEKVIDEFNCGNRPVRFPRTHLVTYIASLELSRQASSEKVDALVAKLRDEYWTRSGTDDGRSQNFFAGVLQAFPNPGPMAAAVITGLGCRNFRLRLWGIPGIGSGCRWLRRQREEVAPGIDFKTFLLRLPPRGAG